MSQLNLPHETNDEKVEKQKDYKVKNGHAHEYRQTVRGIHEVSLEEEKEGCGGKDLRKGRFKAWNEGVRGDGILIIIRIVAYDRIKFCSTTALEIV